MKGFDFESLHQKYTSNNNIDKHAVTQQCEQCEKFKQLHQV